MRMGEKSSEDFFEKALQDAHEAEQAATQGAAIGCAVSFGIFGIMLFLGWLFGG